MHIATLAAAALFTAASGHSTNAQPMPVEFVGKWVPEDGSCRLAAENSGVEFPFFVVTRRGQTRRLPTAVSKPHWRS